MLGKLIAKFALKTAIGGASGPVGWIALIGDFVYKFIKPCLNPMVWPAFFICYYLTSCVVADKIRESAFAECKAGAEKARADKLQRELNIAKSAAEFSRRNMESEKVRAEESENANTEYQKLLKEMRARADAEASGQVDPGESNDGNTKTKIIYKCPDLRKFDIDSLRGIAEGG